MGRQGGHGIMGGEQPEYLLAAMARPPCPAAVEARSHLARILGSRMGCARRCQAASIHDHLRYVLGHREMPPLVHPGILLGYSNATRSPSFEGPNTQWVHLRERTQFRAAARLGDRLIVRWQVEEHKEWLGRRLTRVSCVLSRDDGKQVLDRIMWGLRSSPQRPIPAEDGDRIGPV